MSARFLCHNGPPDAADKRRVPLGPTTKPHDYREALPLMKPPALFTALALALLLTGCGGGGNRGTSASNYGQRMHDRFYKEWIPPASITSRREKLSVPVDVEINSRGQIDSFTIVRPSGNAAVDESINAVAQRVRKVARPPGPATNEPFRLRINFELDVR